MSAIAAKRSVATFHSLLGAATKNSAHAATNRAALRSSLRHYPSSPLRSSLLRAFHTSIRQLDTAQAAAATENAQTTQESEDVTTKFGDLKTKGLVNALVVDTITKGMKINEMTEIQSQTIQGCLHGNDVLAQAKTGTGKTLAFLVPSVQRILEKYPELGNARAQRQRASLDVLTLIISPTRELAEQIAVEARRLVAGTGIKVQCAVGGTQKRMHMNQMRYEGVHILVGTPGRLHDILTDFDSGLRTGKVDTFVLDEADRLLDDGFAPEVHRIHQTLPRERADERQTLMFSATMPQEVMSMVRRFMRPDYKFVKTLQDEAPTHERVPQKVVQCNGMENMFPALLEIVKKGLEAGRQPDGKPFKAIVFLNTTGEVQLYHEMFAKLGEEGSTRFATHPLHRLRLMHMHSKLTQARRTQSSEDFRHSSEAILFASDVAARGMDFPGVTHVIQVGAPRTRESYIHRLGRTGRAGKEGVGYLLVNQLDDTEARNLLQKLPVKRDRDVQAAGVDMTQDAQVPSEVGTTLTQAIESAKRVTLTAKSEAWRALFGTHQFVRYKQDLIDGMNSMSKYGWGMERPPAVSMSLASKLGFSRVRGLNTDVSADREQLEQEEMDAKIDRIDSRRNSRSGGGRDGRPAGGRFGGNRFGGAGGGNFGRSGGGNFGRSGGDRFSRDGRSSRFGGSGGGGGSGGFNQGRDRGVPNWN